MTNVAVRFLIVGISVACALPASAQQYSVTDLGTLGVDSQATGINAAGQIVGYSQPSSLTTHPFVWADGTMQDLGTLPGYSRCYGLAINDSGHVVGSCAGNVSLNLPTQAFVWTPGEGLQSLPNPNDPWAYGINNHGDIVGSDRNGAFLYRDGAFQTLGPGNAVSLNEQNQVVGSRIGVGAVLWDDAGAHPLPIPPGIRAARAQAISADGLVVGGIGSQDDGYVAAAIWTPSGMSDLGGFGGPASSATAIEGRWVVGHSLDPSGRSHAFVYDRNGSGRLVDLNDVIPAASGWMLQRASGVTSSGQIVGWGLIDGVQHAFLLTPSTSGNLLVNAGFEQSDPPALGAGWVSDDIRQEPAKSETNQPHDGSQNGACWVTDNRDCGMYQDVSAPASGTYTLTIFANSDRPGAFVGANVNGSVVASASVEVRGFANYGDAYTLTFEAAQGDTIRVWMYSPAVPGYLVIDDAMLRTTSGFKTSP